MTDLRKHYLVGPWGGEDCCYCCDRCNSEEVGLYNNCTGCPPLCCTCPPLCDLEVTITAHCCFGMNALEITLVNASWDDFEDHYCYEQNPSSFNNGNTACYEKNLDSCPHSLSQHPYEKWANKTGEDWGACFCDSIPTTDSNNLGVACGSAADNGGNAVTCEGIWMTFSLCCCDQQAAAITAEDYEGECKTCSYQFRTEWGTCPGVVPPAGGDAICSCYDGMNGFFLEHEALPPDEDPAAGHGNGNSMIWEHVDGTCGFPEDPTDPFDPMDWRMEYKLGDAANPLYWNCDCCFNTEMDPDGGGFVVPKKSVYFTAVIVPVDGCVKGGP